MVPYDNQDNPGTENDFDWGQQQPQQPRHRKAATTSAPVVFDQTYYNYHVVTEETFVINAATAVEDDKSTSRAYETHDNRTHAVDVEDVLLDRYVPVEYQFHASRFFPNLSTSIPKQLACQKTHTRVACQTPNLDP
jgi:hypothetical protein